MNESKPSLSPAVMAEVHTQRKLIDAAKRQLIDTELAAEAAILKALGIEVSDAYTQVRGVSSKNPELLVTVAGEVTVYSLTSTQAEILVYIGFDHGS